MSFAFFDHTGDIGVRLTADTLDGLFGDAARAFTETVTDLARVEPRCSVPVDVESTAADLLLVDWLSEILYRWEVHGFLVAAVEVQVDAPPANEPACCVHGRLHGETFDPARHGVKVLVKAVTYHALDVRRDKHGWHATVVFDI